MMRQRRARVQLFLRGNLVGSSPFLESRRRAVCAFRVFAKDYEVDVVNCYVSQRSQTSIEQRTGAD